MKRFLAIFLPLLILCCALTMSASAESTATGATAPADIPDVGIKGASLSLKDNVYIYFMLSDSAATSGADDWGVIFYLTDPGESASYATATAEDSTAVVRHKESAYQWTNAATGKVYYSFNYGVYAKQMTDTIYGQGWCRIGDEYYCGNVQPYSVQTYAANKLGINNSTPVSNVTSSTELIDLLVSMLDYGARAQEYLNYNTDNLADSIITSGLSYWKISEAPGCVWVWDYTGTDTVVHIPGVVLEGEYKGCRVTRIGGAVFQDNQTMESITFPSTLERIDVDTFAGSKLWDDPNNWDSGENAYGGSVEKAAFYVNDWLVRLANRGEVATLTIREGTKHINAQNDDTFDGILALRSIHIPASVKTIGDNAFLGCTELASVTFAEDSQLESIGACAFSLLNTDQSKCNYALKSITIPASVKYIGDSAFFGCSGLESITFEPGSKLETIDNMAFGSLPDDYTPLEAITIPASVKTMGYSVFVYCRYLTKVTFEPGSKLESMDTDIFQNCAALKRVENWPAGMKTIPERTFECSGLEGFVIPDGVESIGVIAFGSCEQLETVVIPKSVKSIEELAFTDCTGLKTICYYGTEAEWNAITKDASWDEGAGTYTIIYNFDPTTMPMYKYTVIDEAAKTAKLTGLTMFNNGGALNIPEIIDGYTITVIGASAFEEDATITSVNIPSTVTEIEDFAFDSCTALGTVTFAEGSQLTTVGGRAFAVCTALKSIAVPAGVTEIGNSAFLDCTALETVTFAEDSKLTTLKYQTFFGCTALKSIAVPAGVTEIGNSAFLDCTALGTVTFAEGSQLKKLGYHTFYGCTVLKSIALPDGVTFEDDTFDVSAPCVEKVDGLYYIGRYLIDYDENSPKELTVRAGTKYIVNEAMAYYYQLKSITLPADIVSLGDKAFYDCYRLETIKYLGTQAQWDAITKGSNWDMYVGSYTADNKYTLITTATGLTYIDNGDGKTVTVSGIGTFTGTVLHIPSIVPDGEHAGKKVTAIGNNAFQGTSLTGVVIPEGVTTIGSNAFLNCESLQTVVLPEGVTSINEYAFEFCKKLTAINWPESLTHIADGAFEYCEKLESIHLPKGLTRIEESAFSGCLSLKSITVDPENTAYAVTDGYLYSIADGVLLTAVVGENMVVPANIKRIGAYVFQGNNTLKTVSFAEGSQLESIGDDVFKRCNNLKSIALPEGISKIGDEAFRYCTSLTEITIPASVTEISRYAFDGCSKLADVNFAEGSQLKNIGGSRVFGNCTSLTEFTVPDGITSIKNGMFYGCSALKWVIIPASVTSIEMQAFCNCTSLENIYFVGTQAQWNAITLGSDWDKNTGSYKVCFPSLGLRYELDTGYRNAVRVHSIGNCTDTELVIAPISLDGGFKGSKVTAIRDAALSGEALTEVTILPGIMRIGRQAFSNSKLLTEVTILDSATSIGEEAFSYCTSLTKINLPDGLMSISAGMVEGCAALREIVIPASVTSIGENAFEGCTSLTTIYFLGTEAQWNAITKGQNWDQDTGSSLGGYKVCFTSSGLEYTLNSDGETVTVSGIGSCTDTELTIPNIVPDGQYKGKKVTAIKDRAFEGNTSITSVTVLDRGVTTIGEYAFYNCTALTQAILPDSVTSMGKYVFSGCTGLKDVKFGSGLTAIAEYAFSGSGITGIILADATNYGANVFYAGKDMTSVIVLPTGLKTIEKGAFSDCRRLEIVILPFGSITGIGDSAFSGCTGLETMAFLGTQTQWNNTTKGNDWDKNAGTATAAKTYTFICVPDGLTFTKYGAYMANVTGLSGFTGTTLFIPTIVPDGELAGNSVAGISADALKDQTTIKTVILPGRALLRIHSGSFANCTALESINIPATVFYIEADAFAGCSKLVNITVDAANYSFAVENGCLYKKSSNELIIGAPGLKSITVPSNITSIGSKAFYQNKVLESIIIPTGVTTIGANAFEDCTSLKSIYYCGTEAEWNAITKDSDWDKNTGSYKVYFPNFGLSYSANSDGTATVSGIGSCKDTDLVIFPIVPDGQHMGKKVTAIKKGAFKGNTSITSVVIPDSVTSMGENNASTNAGAFSGCTSLKEVKLGSGLTIIEPYTFINTAITSITIPGNITTIGYQAFQNSSKLETVIISDGVEIIGQQAFLGCSELTTVYIPASVKEMKPTVFYECSKLNTIYYYGTEAEWNAIPKGDSWDGKAGSYKVYFPGLGLSYNENSDGTVTVSGIGSCTDTDLFISAIVPDGQHKGKKVTAIKKGAFKGNTSITSVVIPDSVTSMGENNANTNLGAFSDCTSLKEVKLGSGLTTIEPYTFTNTAITSITIPGNITTIGYKAFQDSSKLETVIISDGLESIGAYVFVNCTKVTVVMPTSVRSIRSNAFDNSMTVNYCGTEAQWKAIDGYGNVTCNVVYEYAKQ